jgi:hypothetical protein
MRKCTICGKGSIMRAARKKLRGKYNPTPKKRKYPNLQWTRRANGKPRNASLWTLRGKRVLACTRCIKTMGKRK